MIHVSDFRDGEIHPIDAGVAHRFFHTAHYPSATAKRIERAMDELDRALRAPKIQAYLEQDGHRIPE